MTPVNIKGKISNIISKRLGAKILQPVFEKLSLVSLAGMNVGGATLDYAANGEVWVMKYIRERYGDTRPLVIFDVGAHKGLYAECLTEVFGQAAAIYCFEPSTKLFAALKEKFAGSPNVEAHRLALSDERMQENLFQSDDLIPTMLPDAFAVTGQKMVASETVESVRLDAFCKLNEINKIHFLKIDVEGYEMKVLQGAGEMLKNIDFIQFEFGQHCVASRTFFYDFFTLLSPFYKIYRVLGKGLHELPSYDTKYELFVSATNYLAVKK